MRITGLDDKVQVIAATSMQERTWRDVERHLSTTDGDHVYLALCRGEYGRATYQGEPVRIGPVSA